MVKLRFFLAGHLEGRAVKILAILVLSSNLKIRRAISSIASASGARAGQDEATHLGIANRGFGASVPKTIDNFALHPETFDASDRNVRPLSRERQPEVRTNDEESS